MEMVELPQSNDPEDLEANDNIASASVEPYQVLDSTTGVVNVVVQPDIPYGIKINNSLNIDLYVRVFYFNPTDFTINSLTGSSASNACMDAELPARGCCIIGRDIGEEIFLELGPDITVELGYFKLFWSTDPFELNIDQPSPFEESDDPELEPEREIVSARHLFRKDWGIALLALVQRPVQPELLC
ncbi:hypothetical protein B0J17DRAFT_718345 [Rhizoctonia solani]|nr:hypothetical protein B0J17DRAFT_718345 [Rhizoctonia solani]